MLTWLRKTVLLLLQSGTKELLAKAQSSEVWAVSYYTRRVSSSSANRDHANQSSVVAGPDVEMTRLSDSALDPRPLSTYSAHDVYFAYFYSSAHYQSEFVDAEAMEERWKFLSACADLECSFEGFTVDDSPCTSGCMWLLASITLALETHLPAEDSAFKILSKVLDRANGRVGGKKDTDAFSAGSFTPRFKADLRYWSAFAKSRGLMGGMSRDRYDFERLTRLERENLRTLLELIFRNTESTTRQHNFGTGYGPLRTIVQSLEHIGLPFTSHLEGTMPNYIVEFGRNTAIPRSYLRHTHCTEMEAYHYGSERVELPSQ